VSGVSAGNNYTVRSSHRKFPCTDLSGDSNCGRGDQMLICKQCQTASATLLFRCARRIHNGRVAPMSQFEDPSAQASVDPYSDAYTQLVAPSRDQELNPRRSRSHSRERPAIYNRTSTPPKRPAHAPIVSYRHGSISGLFIYLSSRLPTHATCWEYSV